jgi:hypothetical protein
MANSLLTINMITREATRLWRNSNYFLRSVKSQYDDQFARTGAKIGATLRVRLPDDFTVRYGAAASVQDTNETSIALTLASQVGVDMSFSTADLTLSMDDFAERILMPAINTTVGAVAVGVMATSEGGVANYTDSETAGAIITPTTTTILNAGAILDTQSSNMMDRKFVVSQYTDARVAGSLTGLFNPVTSISEQYRSGAMKNALGFDWLRDQTVLVHTPGSYNSAATVSGGNQTGTTITTSAISGNLAAGDIVTFALVYGVNHITKQSYGTLKQFVVTAPVASGGTSIPIYPPLIPAAGGQQVQYQTTTISPASGATMTLVSPASTQYRKNIAYAPDAFTLVTADLVMPTGNVEAAREQFDGVSIRVVKQYAIGTDQEITRLDVLYGSLWIRPEWAVVVPDVL